MNWQKKQVRLHYSWYLVLRYRNRPAFYSARAVLSAICFLYIFLIRAGMESIPGPTIMTLPLSVVGPFNGSEEFLICTGMEFMPGPVDLHFHWVETVVVSQQRRWTFLSSWSKQHDFQSDQYATLGPLQPIPSVLLKYIPATTYSLVVKQHHSATTSTAYTALSLTLRSIPVIPTYGIFNWRFDSW